MGHDQVGRYSGAELGVATPGFGYSLLWFSVQS